MTGTFLLLSACGLASALRSLPLMQRPMPQHVQSPVLRAARLAMHVPPVTEAEANSFVQTEMRGAAMALHTRDQAPKEGKQPAQKPVSSWQPGRAEYLQFLVDSREVYSTLEHIVETNQIFSSFANSGLERSDALTKDIAWFVEQGVPEPPVAEYGLSYSAFLKAMVEEGRNEEFVCHFYNFYFAHTAGGRMIGKRCVLSAIPLYRVACIVVCTSPAQCVHIVMGVLTLLAPGDRSMSQMLLDGRTLEFYQWHSGNVDKELLPALRSKSALRTLIAAHHPVC